MNKKTITFKNIKTYPIKEPFNYYHINQPDIQAILELNKHFSVAEHGLVTSEIPPMVFYDIEVTQGKTFPDPKDVKAPVDSIQSYDTVNNRVYLQVTLLHSHRRKFGRTEEQVSENLTTIVNEGYERLCEEDERYKLIGRDMPTIEVSGRFDETDTLREFWDFIKTVNPIGLCGFNSRNFDDPYMMNRTRKLFDNYEQVVSKFDEVTSYSTTQFSVPDFKFIDIQKLLMPTDAGGLNYAQTTLVGGNSLDNFARHFLGVSKVELKGTYFEQFKFQLDNLLLYGVIDTLLLYNLWRKIDLSVKMFPFSITSNAPALFSTRGKVKVYDIATTTELLKSGTIVNNNLLNDEFSVI